MYRCFYLVSVYDRFMIICIINIYINRIIVRNSTSEWVSCLMDMLSFNLTIIVQNYQSRIIDTWAHATGQAQLHDIVLMAGVRLPYFQFVSDLSDIDIYDFAYLRQCLKIGYRSLVGQFRQLHGIDACPPIASNKELIIPPLQRSWKGGILVSPCLSVCPSVHLSVCPSVDRIVSTLYLQQYSSDPFHIPFQNSKNWNFGEFFKFVTLTLLSFDFGSNMTQWYG